MRFLAILAFVLSILTALASGAGLDLRLSVEEQAGLDRIEEPVTFGVPVPEGMLSSCENLALFNESGEQVAASFTVAQRWLDESIQWLHVHTLLSTAAGEKSSLRLKQRSTTAGDKKDSPLEFSLHDQRISIVTGPAKIVLSAETPDLLTAAFFDPTGRFTEQSRVVGGDGGTVSRIGSSRSSDIAPGSGKIEVLESSPMRIVVLLEGKFLSPSGNDPSLSWEARVIAYAGSPRFTIDYTVINRNGETAADKIDLGELTLGVGIPFSDPMVLIGTRESPQRAQVKAEATIFQRTADDYRITWDGNLVSEGPGKSSRTLATGWIDLAQSGRGIAIGIQDFWQTWPKSLGARVKRGSGSQVRIGLYPEGTGKDQELYLGQARTHRLTFLLHDNKPPGDLLREMSSANRPLRVVAEPDWYCRQSLAYGRLAPADADYGAFSEVAAHYEQIVDESMDHILRQMHHGRSSRGVTQDSYGWMNWGDMFFRAPRPDWGQHFDDPVKNLSWSGNYYDYGFAMIMQFMRSGERRYLETGLRAGAYTADVFIVHHHPDPTLVGAPHYCPPRYHAALDNGTPYISRENNHAKSASVLARWQWLGDWWARKVALESFNNALRLEGADVKGWEQCRGNGHRLRILWLGYHFTGERKYRKKAEELIQLGIAHIQANPEFDPKRRESQRFMVGIALEGLILHYWDRPSSDLLEAIQRVADHAYRRNQLNRYTGNMAMAFGFLWKETGDGDYLDALVQIVEKTRATDQAKIFGQIFRSTPWALSYLEQAATPGAGSIR